MADNAGQGSPLPPHGPADMLSLYMTRYDYDYNREGNNGNNGSSTKASSAFDPGVSGDVRNRPIFAYGAVDNDRDARTIYQVDYTGKDRSVKDMQRLAASVKGSGGVAEEGVAVEGDHGTAYQREWYRPGLTKSLRNDDGSLPQTAYQEDYRGAQPSASGKAAGPSSKEPPPAYAGAAATAYNPDLLKPHGVLEDDGADIAPKITSKESLLPRGMKRPPGWTATFDGSPDDNKNTNNFSPATVTRSAGPSSSLGPAAGLPGMYSCTSWDIGDVSQAHPSQLPISLHHSIAASGVDVTANPDKAALLRQLAGGRAVAAASTGKGTALRDEQDRTNPQLLSAHAQKTCAVSRRLEEEHHVQMSMYKSDYVDQGQLPELPGNPAGTADVRDTQTGYTATPGEMTAGQLTKTTRAMGQLRNTHGTLKPAAAGTEPVAVSSMRATEKAMAIDRADPHRHKLRS